MQTVIIKLKRNKKVTCSAKQVTHKNRKTRFIITKLLQKYKRKFFGTLALLSAIALIGVPDALDFGRITFGQAVLASVLSLVSLIVFAKLGGAFNKEE